MAEYTRKLILDDGSVWPGYAFGGAVTGEATELIFHTAMAGYPEIISDPACLGQTVVTTYPVVGSFGVAMEDLESDCPALAGLVARDYNDQPSNFRYAATLADALEMRGIPGIYGVDTRALTRLLRDGGVRRAMLADMDASDEEIVAQLKQAPKRQTAVREVSCRKRRYARTPDPVYTVAAIDCGITQSLICGLNSRGCTLAIFPFDTPAEDILAIRPDGVLISGGPGDPADVPEVVETAKALCGRLPMLGIGLGCQLICRAYGAETVRMPVGHHGCNHAVRNLKTGQLDITTQNHAYTVCEASLEGTGLTVTRKNLMDDTVEGVESTRDSVFGVQDQLDAASGLLDRFLAAMRDAKTKAPAEERK